MRNSLRPLALVLALCVVGSTAALLQTWVHRRTVERQHHTGVVVAPAELEVLRQYRADQQKAFVVLVGVSFAALLVITLISGHRTKPDDLALQQAKTEIKTSAQLARSAATQGEALARERESRERTEQSLHLQQRLVRQTLEEKVRLGRDLHDGTIQSLYATGLVIESARDLVHRDPAETVLRLDTALRTVNDTILSVRSHIKGLSPENVRRDSLIAVLNAVAEDMRAGRDVVFDYKMDDTAALRISTDHLTQIVPFVREAISNALRHGQARHIALRLHEGEDAVCLLVQDDGRGFALNKTANAGHGLANMRARAESMRGSMNFTSTPGSGTRIVLTLPIPRST